MKKWQTSLLLSCLLTPVAYAQPALDPAFIDYLLEFGEQPELFDAAHQELESNTHNAQTQSNNQRQQTANNTKEIKQ